MCCSICGTSKLFFSALLPGSTQIANSYLPPQARLRALTVGLWLVFKLGCNIQPGQRQHQRQCQHQQQHQQQRQQRYTHESWSREKNMKKIYIGKTALKTQRNGCKHQKRRWVNLGILFQTSASLLGNSSHSVWLMKMDSHREIMAIKKLFKT